jgi:hypothetical protein
MPVIENPTATKAPGELGFTDQQPSPGLDVEPELDHVAVGPDPGTHIQRPSLSLDTPMN